MSMMREGQGMLIMVMAKVMSEGYRMRQGQVVELMIEMWQELRSKEQVRREVWVLLKV